MFSLPKSSSPTAPTMAADPPILAHWSMKIAGAPLGKGPRRGSGSRNPSPSDVATISTRISPTVIVGPRASGARFVIYGLASPTLRAKLHAGHAVGRWFSLICIFGQHIIGTVENENLREREHSHQEDLPQNARCPKTEIAGAPCRQPQKS